MGALSALIGVGGIGAYHLASLRKLEEHGQTRLVAVADPTVERFPELRQLLTSRGVRWYLDYQEMLDREADLDAVTIAAPIPFHFDMANACLERGVHVNMEKPPVPVVQQLDALLRVDKDERITVGFQMILSGCVQRMKRLISEHAIGEVRSVRACGCWPRLDSYYQRASWAGKLMLDEQPVFDGPATNALAHVLHNIMFLAAPGAADFAVPSQVIGELYRARPIESYDVACLRGEFPFGIEFSLAVTHATQEVAPFRMEVRGTKGWLRLSEDGANLETSSGESLRAALTTQQQLDTCHQHFLETMRDRNKRSYTSLGDTVGYVRATNGLFLSSGGIHDIAPEWISQYKRGEDVGYNVQGLHAAIEQSFGRGLLFSELGVEWAVAQPKMVQLDSLHTLDLNTALLSAAR